MDDQLKNALQDFRLGTRHEHWHGKTYADFWAWFDVREKALLAQASPEDLDELREQLLELTADCDDAGFAMPPECDNDVITRPE